MNLYFEQLNKTFLLQYLGNIIIIINGNKVLFGICFCGGVKSCPWWTCKEWGIKPATKERKGSLQNFVLGC